VPLIDAVGLAAIAIQLFVLFRWVVPDDGLHLVWEILTFGFLATGAMYVWHSTKLAETISEPSEWAATILLSFVLGAVSFGIDMIIGSINNPGLSAIEAGTKAGSPFGFPLTLLLCPGFTVISVAGLIRSLFLKSESA
jgi:hypothetical protein